MSRPAATEFAQSYAGYVTRVPGTDPLPALEAQPGARIEYIWPGM